MSAGTDTHSHSQAHAHFGAQRQDPTGTKTLRDQLSAQFYKRYRKLKGLVWQGVGVEDRLALRDRARQANIEPIETPEGDLPPQMLPRDEQTAREFTEWFERMQDRLVVGPEQADGTQWSDRYVRTTYRKGVDDATRRAQQAGVSGAEAAAVSFDMPIHQQTLSMLFERNHAALRGVNGATRREVARVLGDAMLEGQNPRVAARAINDRIDAIGITRARTHARTMLVGTYNEAALRRYEQLMGADASVTVLVEFSTAQDGRVCPECESLAGQRYSVREARGVIPVHPRCRCTWVPVPPGSGSQRGGLF